MKVETLTIIYYPPFGSQSFIRFAIDSTNLKQTCLNFGIANLNSTAAAFT